MVDADSSPSSPDDGAAELEPVVPSDTVLDGKYELRGVLGEGGTGIVYDAIRLSDSSPVALKVMHPQLAGDAQIRGRFRREAAILRRLEGDHICPILELGEVSAAGGTDTLLYMALPKLDGPTFERVLVTEKPVDVARALDVMLDICAALRIAHAQGIVHRDLKPANVILVSGKSAVVVDFGLSKIVTGTGTGTTNLTAHNMVFGTPEYMSPEQARGDEIDARCDVYAAGVMLYEILTGAPPFTGPSPLNVLTEHLTGVVEPPSKRALEGRVTPALESVVMHALARARDDRYPSASALSAAIRHARARPLDVASLSPAAFATSPPGTDAFAVTMPALDDAAMFDVRAGVSSDTLLASALPQSPSTLPPAAVRSAKPSSAPPRSPAPSKNPSSSPSARSSAPLSVANDSEATRTWILLWVLAGLVSIGVGVYFALR